MGRRGRPAKSKEPKPTPKPGLDGSFSEDKEIEKARLLSLRATLKEIEVKRSQSELIDRELAEKEWTKIRAELSHKTFKTLMGLKLDLIKAFDPIDVEEILKSAVIEILASESKKAQKIRDEKDSLKSQMSPDMDELAGLSPEALEARIDEEKTRLTKAEADRRELELSHKKGNLISYKEIEELWIKRGGSYRSRLLTMPPRLAKEVSIIDDEEEMTKLLTTAIDEITRELSSHERRAS